MKEVCSDIYPPPRDCIPDADPVAIDDANVKAALVVGLEVPVQGESHS